MAQATLLKLPSKYYRRRALPPRLKLKDERFVARIHANLGTGGRHDAKARSNLRKMLLYDMVEAIINDSRRIHMNVTVLGSPELGVNGFKQLRDKGLMSEKVAVIVDGSPAKPIKNVKFAGNITFQAEASRELMIEAAKFAWGFIISRATKFPSGSPPKKNNSYRYKRSFEMFVSDATRVMSPSDLNNESVFTADDFISISNYVPYAQKLERYYYPQGAFYLCWKALRKKYGNRLAIRFDFVESTLSQHNAPGSGGASVPLAQPVIRIGQPDAFPSRAVNMKKYIRDNARDRKNRKKQTRGKNWKRTQ